MSRKRKACVDDEYETALATLHQMEDAHVCSIMTQLVDQVRYREAMRAVWADLPADVRKRLATETHVPFTPAENAMYEAFTAAPVGSSDFWGRPVPIPSWMLRQHDSLYQSDLRHAIAAPRMRAIRAVCMCVEGM